jgi:hypothetical protein
LYSILDIRFFYNLHLILSVYLNWLTLDLRYWSKVWIVWIVWTLKTKLLIIFYTYWILIIVLLNLHHMHYTINDYASVILSGIRLNCFRNWTSCMIWIYGRDRINSYVGYPVGMNYINKNNIYVVKSHNLTSKNSLLCAY